MNEQAVLGCRRAGEGLFVEALDRELKRRRLTVPALEHDLAEELRLERQALLAVRPPRTLGAPVRLRALAPVKSPGDAAVAHSP